jgi:hypothetical protein
MERRLASLLPAQPIVAGKDGKRKQVEAEDEENVAGFK